MARAIARGKSIGLWAIVIAINATAWYSTRVLEEGRKI